MIDPLEMAAARAEFLLTMPDTAEIRRKSYTGNPTQPGRRTVADSHVATVPAKIVASPRNQTQAGGQVVELADWAIRLPAGQDVRTNDRVIVTLGETGETKTGEVEAVIAKSGELARLVTIRKTGL